MSREKFPGALRYLALMPLLFLGGCSTQHFWLFNPKGPISETELHYLILDVAVMLVIIIPTTLMVIWFLWRYRKNAKTQAAYDPNWTHSNILEVIVWGVPVVIVAILGYYSYVGIHEVNPYNPTILASKAQSGADPLEIDVVTTDWQWLFIYPKQHIAVSNELVIPTHTKVDFRLTSTSVTNNFFIPQLVGQIYIMPGMRTKQSLLAEHAGEYHGFSASLSGGGFAWMNFKTKAVSQSDFDTWVAKVQQSDTHMSYADFEKFARPTVNIGGKTTYFSNVEPGLFTQVIKAAKAGKVYPTPNALTENMQSEEFLKHSN
ncbi:cytochrome ubiquinol oxidase subunit II [Acidihalobacter prosperus]|uniref:Ubiquinol oxidase subunit 2 n=1 Tax=Acidihalobacter prosperus TaxID=160660 RepID=A0A1A6C8Q6_9GAMM|nr:COX aromatic rich motif-containing protein [Acidihalobacter prosperus]OBS10929.1 cytochrome ubiquinol oxidase subunit II [Acidihalobacter prosperus]